MELLKLLQIYFYTYVHIIFFVNTEIHCTYTFIFVQSRYYNFDREVTSTRDT